MKAIRFARWALLMLGTSMFLGLLCLSLRGFWRIDVARVPIQWPGRIVDFDCSNSRDGIAIFVRSIYRTRAVGNGPEDIERRWVMEQQDQLRLLYVRPSIGLHEFRFRDPLKWWWESVPDSRQDRELFSLGSWEEFSWFGIRFVQEGGDASEDSAGSFLHSELRVHNKLYVHTREIYLRHWVLCIPWAIFPILLARKLVHARRRRLWLSMGRCQQCGYDMRATPERCPECGHTIYNGSYASLK